MRFDGNTQRSEIYGILPHSNFPGLFMSLSPLEIIHFHHDAVNFEAQSEIIGFELEITGWSTRWMSKQKSWSSIMFAIVETHIVNDDTTDYLCQ